MVKAILFQLVKEPIFFERNRVYRIYKGGMPYKELFNDGFDDGTERTHLHFVTMAKPNQTSLSTHPINQTKKSTI